MSEENQTDEITKYGLICQIFIHFPFTAMNSRPVFGGENTLTSLKTFSAHSMSTSVKLTMQGRKHSFTT